MSTEKRTPGKLPSPGPYLAEVTNHLDSTNMGSMEVVILKSLPNPVSLQGNTFIVKYLSPFYGVTSSRFEGNNPSDFNDVQKSYGMWMIPPDVGTTVMVIFVDGEPNAGYWFGCVPDRFQNHMVPGIAASRYTMLTPEQRRKYGTDYLPVAEFNKKTQKLDNVRAPGAIGKPIHPFADRLLAQGLLLDDVRGVTSSSARREVPLGVFGISTPGPLDTSPGAKRGKIGYKSFRQAPVSRLGGTTFVMDDGDINGQNELVRIRTRTGHQILLHNSHDLVYIANSKGTAWIELTSNGKIDIYAEDSVSIHTKNDFNFRADRDVNIEAGRNINIRAINDMNVNIKNNYSLIVDNNSKIAIAKNKDETIGENNTLNVINNFDLLTGADVKISSNGSMNLSSEASMKQSTAADFHVGVIGNYYETAAQIHMNGPAAEAAQPATQSVAPVRLAEFELPNRDNSAGWADGNFYKSDSVKSIMKRVPTHEPWDHHENNDPAKFRPSGTDNTQ